jgi:hypothetical protein
MPSAGIEGLAVWHTSFQKPIGASRRPDEQTAVPASTQHQSPAAATRLRRVLARMPDHPGRPGCWVARFTNRLLKGCSAFSPPASPCLSTSVTAATSSSAPIASGCVSYSMCAPGPPAKAGCIQVHQPLWLITPKYKFTSNIRGVQGHSTASERGPRPGGGGVTWGSPAPTDQRRQLLVVGASIHP